MILSTKLLRPASRTRICRVLPIAGKNALARKAAGSAPARSSSRAASSTRLVHLIRVLINHTKPISVPFHAVASVELLESDDLSLSLRNGARVVVPASKLEDADGAWLKKELRREVRHAHRIEQARASAAASCHSGGSGR